MEHPGEEGGPRGPGGAAGRDGLWAVGWEGSIAHFDGETLTPIVRPRPTRATLHAVDGRPGGLALAVGEDGTVLRLVASGS